MSSMSIREFMPTILFLGKFIGLYVVINLLYGIYVSSYLPGPDPATSSVSVQTSIALNVCGWSTETKDNTSRPTTRLSYKERDVLAIYEGCNGINVMIIFVAFLIAFGPITKSLLWFIPAGLLVLHVMNLARISILFWVSLYEPDYMYILHKYFFTAVLYVVTFGLWVIWVRKFSFLKVVNTG
jgi:exosortase family protein XrtF